MTTRLKKQYDDVVRAKLKAEFNYANDMEVPRIEKIVINMGVGEATETARRLPWP
jgi:large subunit ribosomal protein L5